jgi:hypothetical protein
MQNLYSISSAYQSQYNSIIYQAFHKQSDNLNFTINLPASGMKLYFVVHPNETCDIHLLDEHFEMLASTYDIYFDYIECTIRYLLK